MEAGKRSRPFLFVCAGWLHLSDGNGHVFLWQSFGGTGNLHLGLGTIDAFPIGVLQ